MEVNIRARKREKIGPIAQKALILLYTGLALSFSRRPDKSMYLIKSAIKEWQRINQRSLRDTIRWLYQSKLVDYREHKDGTITLVLSEEGKKRALQYHPEAVRVRTPERWDGMWRMVMFDIPERHKKGRDALAGKLKRAGFYQMQKSVLVHPYPCRDEIDFLVELFEVRPYVRFAVVKEIDIGLDLKRRFHLR